MKITFVSKATVSAEGRAANAQQNKALGLPEYTGSGRLAVVGGGNSINDHIEELRNWDGQIWAVNGTINWCLDHGIDASFYTLDAAPTENWTYPLDRVTKAVLSIECDPTIFALFAGLPVTTLWSGDAGPTSAAGAALLAIVHGHDGVTFFGCESSYGETTHAYPSPEVPDWIVAKVGDQTFRTKPEFADQAKAISIICRDYPHVYSERGGGLVKAMIEHGEDYDTLEMSPWLWAGSKRMDEYLKELKKEPA